MPKNVSFGEKEKVTKTAQFVLTANTFQSVHNIPFQIKNIAKIIIPLKHCSCRIYCCHILLTKNLFIRNRVVASLVKVCICCLLLEFRVKSEPENKEGKITFFVEFPFLFLRDTKRVTTQIHEEKKQLYFKIGERVSITAFISL